MAQNSSNGPIFYPVGPSSSNFACISVPVSESTTKDHNSGDKPTPYGIFFPESEDHVHWCLMYLQERIDSIKNLWLI